eukprot:RCo035868
MTRASLPVAVRVWGVEDCFDERFMQLPSLASLGPVLTCAWHHAPHIVCPTTTPTFLFLSTCFQSPDRQTFRVSYSIRLTHIHTFFDLACSVPLAVNLVFWTLASVRLVWI